MCFYDVINNILNEDNSGSEVSVHEIDDSNFSFESEPGSEQEFDTEDDDSCDTTSEYK